MFAEYDYSQFPIVNVILHNIENEDDFNSFLDEWLKLYIRKKDFTFIFDTRKVHKAPLKYSIRMSEFIKQLKKDYSYHYLKKSIILVSNNLVKNMLNGIFKLQSPVAPVYLISDITDIDLILNDNFKNNKNIKLIKPN